MALGSATNDAMGFTRARAKDITVIGDVFTMDLSLPHRLGMNCVLGENEFQDGFKTPRVFIEHANENAVPVVSDIMRAVL